MELLPSLCLVFVAFTGLTKGAGVLPDGPLNKTVGGTAMFTTSLPPQETPLTTVIWNFGGATVFLTSSGSTITIHPAYKDRITFFESTGSLELRNLSHSDSGLYNVNIISDTIPSQAGSTELGVYDPVTVPVVTASSTDLVEFNSSVRLSCSSSGSSPSFLWLNGSSVVTQSDRVQLTDGGANLTIINVTRYDQGPFRCNVFNPASEEDSEPIPLSISYGPDDPHLIKSPPKEYFAEGSDISLTCSTDSRPAAQFTWFLNGSLIPSETGRELRLMKIQMSQSGNYSCQAFNSKTLRYETSQPAAVSVLEPVSNIVVTSNPTDLLEFNSSVRLSCSSSGSSPSFLWLNGSSVVTQSDRVQLTDGGANLTIINVTRFDQGPFRCNVSNPVSDGTSRPISISVNYGPESIKVTKSPSQENYAEGSDISLMCSADSRPAAQFTWFLNRELQSETGPELRLMNIQMSQSGNYSCQAFNSKTLRSLMSQPTVVSVLELISGASVTPSPGPPIEKEDFNLTCEAAGSVFTREWKKGGSDLTLTEDMTLHHGNRVLSFRGLDRKHSGVYSCEISNPLSSQEATHTLNVFYEPENVHITGPHKIALEETLTLKCSAESSPSATYIWKLNGTEIHKSAVFTKVNTGFNDSGSYICEAMNTIGTKSSAVHELSVTGPSGSGCHGGCIAGIVIGVLLGCALACGGGFYIYKKKRTTTATTTTTTTTSRSRGEGQENNAYSGGQEVNYADVNFFQNKDGGRIQLGSQSDSSEYAQVRLDNPSSPPGYEAHMERVKSPAPQPTDVYSQVRKN